MLQLFLLLSLALGTTEEAIAGRGKPCRACRTAKCRKNCFNADDETEVGSSSCSGLSCSACIGVPGYKCSFADGKCWVSEKVPMTATSFAWSEDDCPKEAKDSYEAWLEEQGEYDPYDWTEDATGAVGPSWLFGGMERPAGKETVGSATLLVYTKEQQKRLGVNKYGEKTDDKPKPKPMLGGNPATWSPKPKPMLGKNPATWSPKTEEAEYMALTSESLTSVDFLTYGFALVGLGFLLFQSVKLCRKHEYTPLVGNEQNL